MDIITYSKVNKLQATVNQNTEDIDDLQNTLIKTIPWNLAKWDNAEIIKGYYISNTQTVGQTLVRTAGSNFYTIKAPVTANQYVYFLCEKYATQYSATGYNGKTAVRFAVFSDSHDTFIEGYSYPQPFIYNNVPTKYLVPNNAKWIYVSCSTTDNSAIAQDESNMGYYWVTHKAENEHIDTYESVFEEIGSKIETIESSVSALNNKTQELPAVQLVRKPTFAFIFDDGTDGDINTKALFDSYGFKCGFALIADSSLASKAQRYLWYQDDGYEILAHSVNGDAWDSISSANAMQYAKGALDDLTEAGFDVTGWVTPSTWTNTNGLNAIKKYYQHGWGHWSDESSTDPLHTFGGKDVRQLERWSLQSNPLNDTLAKITSTVSNNGLLCFYGHSYPQTGDYMTVENMKEILDTLAELVSDGDAQVLIPRKAINDYFAMRYSDYLALLS